MTFVQRLRSSWRIRHGSFIMGDEHDERGLKRGSGGSEKERAGRIYPATFEV